MNTEEIKKLEEARNYLFKAEKPEDTDSFTTIPYQVIIEVVKEICNKNGFKIVGEYYNFNNNAKLAFGVYHLEDQNEYPEDPDLGFMLTWVNSYNKQLKFACCAGAYVKLNGNVIIHQPENPPSRKLKGDPTEIAREIIEAPFDTIYENFKGIVTMKNLFKQTVHTDQEFAHFIGELYVLNKSISSDQFNAAVKEFQKPSFEYKNERSAWVMYNHILCGLVTKAHPLRWIKQLQEVQDFFTGVVTTSKFEHFQEDSPVKGVAPVEEETEEINTENLREQILSDLSPNIAADVEEEEEFTPELVNPANKNVEDPSVHTRKMSKEEILKEYGDVMPEEQKKKIEEISSSDSPEEEKEEERFMSIGKIQEILPDFKQGDTFEFKGEILKVGKQTVMYGLPGYILEPISVHKEEVREEKDLADEVLQESRQEIPESKEDFESSDFPQEEEVEKPTETKSTGLPIQKGFGEKINTVHQKPISVEEVHPNKSEEVAEVLAKSAEEGNMSVPIEGESFTDKDSNEKEIPITHPFDDSKVIGKVGIKNPVMMSHEEIEIIPPAKVGVQVDPKNDTLIRNMIRERYGNSRDQASYNVNITSRQVNVLLNTGETFTATTHYFNKELEKL